MAPSRRTPDRRPRAGGRGTGAPTGARAGSNRSGGTRPTAGRTSAARTSAARTATAGTAAPAVGARPGAAPEPGRTGEGGRSSGRVAVVGLILLVLVISYASSLRAWLQQRDDVSQARAELALTQERIDALEETKLRSQDPAYIEQQARLRLGWVLPGEVGYRVIGADGEPLGDTVLEPESLVEEPAREDWYVSVWGSIEAAGEEPEADEEPEQTGPDPDQVLRPDRDAAGDPR